MFVFYTDNINSFMTEVPISVAKNRGAREQRSHEVKTRCTKCDPGCKTIYRRKKFFSETNIQNVQNENSYGCATHIYIYPRETRRIIWEKIAL